MKTLLLFYSDLLEEGKDKLYQELENNIKILKKTVGVDSIYASISSQFKDIFDRFPDLCLINSLRDNPVFAAYRGLRKLRGSDVLLIDGGAKFNKENILSFFNRFNVTVGMIKEKWSGLALIKMRDIDYVIKSMERNFEKNLLDAFYTLRDSYSVVTEFVQLKSATTAAVVNE